MHKHKKQFGQNFLNDNTVLQKIMESANIDDDETILEIGPGDGKLTKELLESAKKVISVEIDRDLENVLKNKFGSNEKFKLIMKDVLKLNFDEEIGEKVKVVANIPYYITSPIINKLIENRANIDEIYIMVQKEVAERISAEPDSKEYSVLTLAVKYYGDAEILFTIPRECFTPAPNVDSAFMRIRLRKDNKYEKIIDEKEFFTYIKAAFANKRKNIVNNLMAVGFEKNELKDIFTGKGIDINKRAEDFHIDEFINIIDILKKAKGF